MSIADYLKRRGKHLRGSARGGLDFAIAALEACSCDTCLHRGVSCYIGKDAYCSEWEQAEERDEQ